MIDPRRVHSLPHLTTPVLTAYLDTNPANHRNQGRPPGYMTWLKSRGQFVAELTSGKEKKIFGEQLHRVSRYLRAHPSRRRGTIVFSGPRSWEFLELQVDVSDELHWGQPAYKQLLWIMDEHRPVGAVLVKKDEARLFRISFGEITEDEQHAISIDTSRWRKKHLVGPSHPYVGKAIGSQRDTFRDRVEEQYRRFHREVAEHIRQWANREKMSPVVLAGPNRILEAIEENLPADFRERVALLKGDLWGISPAALQARMTPAIRHWERTHELTMVSRLLAAERSSHATSGIDKTLDRLQRGQVRQMVIARDLRGEAYQCEKCGHLDRSVREGCPNCGGKRRKVSLRAALPDLARRYATPIEMVGGEAAAKLRKKGGVAAWLRYPAPQPTSLRRSLG